MRMFAKGFSLGVGDGFAAVSDMSSEKNVNFERVDGELHPVNEHQISAVVPNLKRELPKNGKRGKKDGK